MSSSTSKVGHTLAKGLGIKIPYRDPLGSEADPVTRGESVFTSGTAETYIEPEPTVVGWIQEQIPTTHDIFNYFVRLFPFLKWITRYNTQWLIGDLVAGMFSPLLFRFLILTARPSVQVSLLAPLSFPKECPTLNWLICPSNTASIPHLWVF
jgi:hypothetical protein